MFNKYYISQLEIVLMYYVFVHVLIYFDKKNIFIALKNLFVNNSGNNTPNYIK